MLLCHYLLVYSFDEERLIHEEAFKDPTEAVEAYAQMERQYRRDEGVEIVLVGADSLDTVKRTHAHYFDDTPARSRYLSGV